MSSIKEKVKKSVVNISKKNQLIRSFVRFLVYIKRRVIFITAKMTTKLDEKTVIFESFMGRSYSDNPRAIYEEMLRNEKYRDYKFIWAFKDPFSKRNIPELERAMLVKYGSKDYYKSYASAKYFVSNSRIPEAIKPSKDQVYVQTWHGTPLKRLGYDLSTESGNALNSLKDMRKKYKDDAVRYKYMISPSEFCTEKFNSAFNLKVNNPKCEILQVGYPRNDILSNYTDEDIKKVKKNLNIENINKKIILYAPTWRDNQHVSGVGYTYKADVDFDLLREKLGEDYIILFRAHYFVANSFDFEKYSGFVYDVSNYENISDLYIIADMLMTDYSSVFFDYAILKRPIIFYMYDLEAYRDDIRGFYIDLKELPGDIIQTEEEVVESIKKVSKGDFYTETYKKFNEKFNSLEDGKASIRVIEKVIK